MFAPILPRPIIPICMSDSFLSEKTIIFGHCLPSFGLVSNFGFRVASCFCSFLICTVTQLLHCRCYAFPNAENSRTGHQYVGACVNRQRRCLRIDTAVNLQVAARLELLNHLAHPPDLWQSRWNEMLSPKTRVDRHD